MAVIRQPSGKVEAMEGIGGNRHPAIIRSTQGLGQAVLVAFALDQPPFRDWPDRAKLVGKLLDLVLDEPATETAYGADVGPVSHRGFSDLAGQLRSGLDQFAGVRVARFSWIALLTVAYLVIIGPLDFWLVRHVLRRPEWTWISFPLTVATFTCLAAALAIHWKGEAFRANQATLVDADLITGTVRGTTWAHLFSPTTAQVQIATQPIADFDYTSAPQTITSWHGLPGDGFGGLERDIGLKSFGKPYEAQLRLTAPEGAQGRLRRFPIAVWSSRSFLGQWWARANFDGGSGTELRATADSILSGQVVNPLPCDLVDGYLIFDRWAYRIGNLSRGATVQVNERPIDLQTLLTQRTIVKGVNVVTPWDQGSRDVERILQLMMFYGAAKGRAYTQLDNRFQPTLDWSDHLTANQAVLWGRSATPAAALRVDGREVKEQTTWTYYRLLIPVARRGD
jgi:hypothetical protein